MGLVGWISSARDQIHVGRRCWSGCHSSHGNPYCSQSSLLQLKLASPIVNPCRTRGGLELGLLRYFHAGLLAVLQAREA